MFLFKATANWTHSPLLGVGFLLFSAINSLALTVSLQCDDRDLVEGQEVHVLAKVTPEVPKASPLRYLGSKGTFADGSCRVPLTEAGTYRFDVLFTRPDGVVVSLSSSECEVAGDTEISLEPQGVEDLRLTFRDNPIPIGSAQFRIPGTMVMANVEDPSPKVILTSAAAANVRLISRHIRRDSEVHTVIWSALEGGGPTIEITDDWHSVCKFRSLDEGETTDAEATFFLPEARRGMEPEGNTAAYEQLYAGQNPDDLLVVPMTEETTLITNRRFMEFWYSYTNASGDDLRFCRRPITLSEQHEIGWGGELRLTAHARVMMTWVKDTRAIAWGADLISPNGHRLNLPEDAVGLPGDGADFPEDSQIGWSQRLLRRDGESLTLGSPTGSPDKKNNRGIRTDAEFQLEEYLTEDQFPEAFDRLPRKDAVHGVNVDVSDLFEVEVAYTLGGQEIKRRVGCTPWVTFQSDRNDFEAPLGMNDVAMSMMDRIDRTWAYGSAVPKKRGLERITTRWTGCRWQGYSVGGAHNHVQLGMATLRRRHSIYGSDWGPAHEYLHSWGYPHGRGHNEQIRRLRRHYREHHIFLADHPDYEPEPIEIKSGGQLTNVVELYQSATAL